MAFDSPALTCSLQIEDLSHARAFAHPIRNLRIIETHISWVVLTGDYAYKIKKPVEFDFVDYSSLERREYFCYEELRLNRRYADSIYLSVVPISLVEGRIRFDDDSNTVDYAVKMRQFPQHAIVSNLLKEADCQSAFRGLF